MKIAKQISKIKDLAEAMKRADNISVSADQFMNKESTDGKTVFHFSDGTHVLFHANLYDWFYV